MNVFCFNKMFIFVFFCQKKCTLKTNFFKKLIVKKTQNNVKREEFVKIAVVLVELFLRQKNKVLYAYKFYRILR